MRRTPWGPSPVCQQPWRDLACIHHYHSHIVCLCQSMPLNRGCVHVSNLINQVNGCGKMITWNPIMQRLNNQQYTAHSLDNRCQISMHNNAREFYAMSYKKRTSAPNMTDIFHPIHSHLISYFIQHVLKPHKRGQSDNNPLHFLTSQPKEGVLQQTERHSKKHTYPVLPSISVSESQRKSSWNNDYHPLLWSQKGTAPPPPIHHPVPDPQNTSCWRRIQIPAPACHLYTNLFPISHFC